LGLRGMTKNIIGPFSIIGADDPAISAAKDVTISLHDDRQNIIKVSVQSDLLQVISQQLIAAAKSAESAPRLAAEPSLPVIVEAHKATVVREPGQGLFFIFEVNDGLSYIFPIRLPLATSMRDELIEALTAPLPSRTVN
jgi:hypothetical protein